MGKSNIQSLKASNNLSHESQNSNSDNSPFLKAILDFNNDWIKLMLKNNLDINFNYNINSDILKEPYLILEIAKEPDMNILKQYQMLISKNAKEEEERSRFLLNAISHGPDVKEARKLFGQDSSSFLEKSAPANTTGIFFSRRRRESRENINPILRRTESNLVYNVVPSVSDRRAFVLRTAYSRVSSRRTK